MIGKAHKAQSVLAAVILIVGFAAVYGTSDFVSSQRPALPESFGDEDLHFSGSRLKGFAFGMEGLAADWYYVRSLQYIGDKVMLHSGDINIEDLRALNPRLLYPLLANATDLDPHYIAAYTYGGIVLPAIDWEKAVILANKGIANNPVKWQLYQNLGYIQWRLGKYDEAAATFDTGSAVEGSSAFLKLMAAVMRTKGGSRDTARAIYTEMLSSSEDWQVTITASRRLKELTSLDERDAVNRVLTDVRERSGQCPATLREILPQLARIKLPDGSGLRIDAASNLVDPSDTPYLLDREPCTMILDASKTMIATQ